MTFEAFKTHIQKLDRTYRHQKGRDDLRRFYLEVLSLVAQIEDRPKYLWVGLSEDGIFAEKLTTPVYQNLHVLHKTDSNLLLGDFVYHKKNNSFFPALQTSFFVDSWNGHFYGLFNPFKILEDHLHQKAS